MKRALQTYQQLGKSKWKKRRLLCKASVDFLSVWSMFQKLPSPLIKLTLLYLSEDYLWTFWHKFDKSLYRDVYFSQYEIESSSGLRIMEQSRRGNIFPNLTCLSLSLTRSFCVSNCKRTFPVLKQLSLLKLLNAYPLRRMIHPTLEVIRLQHVSSSMLGWVLDVDWCVNCPKLTLLENNMWGKSIAVCRSDGLPLMRPEKGTKEFYILHIDILTNGSSSLDLSLLPEGPECEDLILAAKSFSNIEKMLQIREKFPALTQVVIYTSSILERDLIDKITVACGSSLVLDLIQLKHDLSNWS